MKKVLLILICLLCSLVLIACNNTSEQTAENIDVETTEKITEKTTDKVQGSESAEITSNDITDSQETELIPETSEHSTTKTTEASSTEAGEDISTEEITTEEVTEEDNQSACVVIESSKTDLIPGDEFTITISIKNNPGIFSFTFALTIDNNVFEFISSSTKDSLCASFGICKYDEDSRSYKFNGYGPSIFENLSDDGKVVTITLKVNENVVPGQYALSINPDHKNIINVDGNLVEFKGSIITISVSKQNITRPKRS